MITRLLVSAYLVLGTGLAAQDMTNTGFYFPRSQNIGPYASFLDSSCGNENNYLPNQFHLGKDSWAYLGQPVFAIADGEVVWVSLHGWIYGQPTAAGDGIASNIGLLTKHQTSQGFWFQAVYGHILTTLKRGDKVYAGKQIGTIGPYGQNNDSTHVHFGVRIPLIADASDNPASHYGNAYCNEWPLGPQDRWVDPIQFITTRSPNNYLGTVTPPAATTGNLNISFSSNLVSSSSDGAWYYTVYVQETAGVAVALTQMMIGGVDYTDQIANWFGTTTVPANGQLSVNIKTTGSPGPLVWQFSSGKITWSASINLTE